MMQYKLIAAGLGLVGYGGLIGWAITGDRLEAKMRTNQRLLGDIIERQAAEIVDLKARILDDMVNHPEQEPEWAEAVSDPEPMGDDEVSTDELREKLQAQINEYVSDEETRSKLHESVEQNFGDDRTPPFVISHAKYNWDEEEGDAFDKAELKYYPRYNGRPVLNEEEGFILTPQEVDRYIGWHNLDRFGDESENADVVYIRSRINETDYEVERIVDEEPPAWARYGFGRDEWEANERMNSGDGVQRFRRSDAGD